jgi:hypothetical protein
MTTWGPPPPRRGLPSWAIATIIVSTLVPIVVGVVVSLIFILQPSGPDKADFDGFDACSLISAEDAERAGVRRPAQKAPIQLLGRLVRTTEQGVAIDTCQYGAEPKSVIYPSRVATVEVSVSPATVLDDEDFEYPATKRKPLSGIGDEAYSFEEPHISFKVVGRRGSSQFSIKIHEFGMWVEPGAHENVIELARKIAAGVPAKLTLPAKVAGGPCAQIDEAKISAALGGPVTYSRSYLWHRRGSHDLVVCSYASSTGRTVTARLREKLHHSGSHFDSRGERKDIGGRQAFVRDGTVTFGKTWSTRRAGHSSAVWWVSTLAIDFGDTRVDYALADTMADTLLYK